MKLAKLFPKDGQKNCKFLLGAHNHKQFPDTFLPEISFIGASNVGKSSLINALTSQKIAITSNTPGRTRQLNFFCLSDALILVDMPGYGFAKANDRHIQQWQRTCSQYFSQRQQLQRVFILIDPIKGIKEPDFDTLNTLDSLNVPFQIILTKIDKIKPNELTKTQENIINQAQIWSNFIPEIISCCAKTSNGILDLKKTIVDLL